MPRLMLCCLFGIGVWFCHTNVSAQDAPEPPGYVEKSGTPIIRQAPLTVFVDSDGRWLLPLRGVWSLNILDDFQRFLLGNQQNPAPPYIIRNVVATGTVVGNRVETNAQIEFTTSGLQLVQVPLGFKEGVLPGQDLPEFPSFRYTGPGSASLSFDSQEGHYIALVTPHTPQASESEDSNRPEKPETTQTHSIFLSFWFPLAPNGGNEKRLPVSFPQSTRSQFLLEVPMLNVDAATTRGFIFDEQEDSERQSTVLSIQGLRSDTEITWRKREVEIVDDRPVLHVERAAIDVKLAAPSALYDAVLPVSSTTGSFDQLQIQLPKGSVLDRNMVDLYATAGNYAVEDTNEDSVVVVRFPQKIVGPVSIHLRVTQHFEGDTSEFRRDLAGFEVLGAERQSGVLVASVLSLDSAMKSRWETIRGISRAEGSSSSVGTGDTRFEFMSQPFLLRVQVSEPQTRITVRPDYQFRISQGRVTMMGKLSYTVSGSKVNVLYLRFPDSQWEWEFGTAGLVDAGGVEWDEGELKIPLHSSQESTFDIDFSAHRMIDAEDGERYRLVLPIPRPSPEQVPWSEPADVAIISAHNVEVLPVEQDMRGLTRATRRATLQMRIDTTDSQPEILSYRTELPDALFVADVVFQQQKTQATMRTEVQLFEEYDQVRQTLSYNVAFGLIDRVFLLVPRALDVSGDVQVQLNNNLTLDLRDTMSLSSDNVPDNWVRKLVQLPALMSQFQLSFQYSLTPLAVANDDTVPFSMPFICPVAEVPVTDHRIHFFTPSGYHVGLQSDSNQLWEPFREPRRPSPNASAAFRSVQSPMRIALFVSAAERNVPGATIVERAWLQTWLTGEIRVDRATYLLRSTNESVTLQLPPDAIRDYRVAVRVARQLIEQPSISPMGMLTLPIMPEQYNRPIEVSVEYRYSFELPSGEVSVTLPTFVEETLVQYLFWQVILQQNQHIIGTPTGWTLEYDWSWNGLFWWRVPSIRKGDLGFELDSAIDEAGISKSSQYVFSRLQPTQQVTLFIVNRSSIILVSSSIALLIGLVLIYVPQSRYAGSLFGLGVVLVSVIFYQPPLALLGLHAAAFGVFLALGAGYVYRILHRQKQWIPPAFPMMEDLSHPHPTPVPLSQTIHEVVVDDSGSKEPSVINNQQM